MTTLKQNINGLHEVQEGAEKKGIKLSAAASSAIIGITQSKVKDTLEVNLDTEVLANAAKILKEAKEEKQLQNMFECFTLQHMLDRFNLNGINISPAKTTKLREAAINNIDVSSPGERNQLTLGGIDKAS